METSSVVKPKPQEEATLKTEGPSLPIGDLKRLADFFSILIQIDRREKVTKMYDKQVQ